MAIEDAGALAAELSSHVGDPEAALAAFQRARIPDTAREVLFSRHLGRVKQMLAAPTSPADGDPVERPGGSGGWAATGKAERFALGQANMARFPVPDQFRGC